MDHLTNRLGVELRTDGWAFSFDILLNDEAGAATFMRFLRKERNSLKLIFWLKCRNYKKLYEANAQNKKIKAAMKNIYKKHIKEKSSTAVDIPSEMRKQIQEKMNKDIPQNYNLFDPAQKLIYLAMFKQSYGSFLKSKWFLEAAARESKSLKFRHSKLKVFHIFLKANRVLCL